MTNTLNKIMHDGDEYLLPDTTYTAGSGISINQSNEISNTGVTSFNGQTGAVTYTAPVSSVNNQTGAVTVLESLVKVFSLPQTPGDDMSDIVDWLSAGKVVVFEDGGHYYQVTEHSSSSGEIHYHEINDGIVSTGSEGCYCYIIYYDTVTKELLTTDDTRYLLVPTGGTNGQVLTATSSTSVDWENPTGTTYNAGEGIEIRNGGDYSAMQGPCPTGFHVPLPSDWENVISAGIALGRWTATNGDGMSTDLKLPYAGELYFDDGQRADNGEGVYWSCQPYSEPQGYALYASITSNLVSSQYECARSEGGSVRPFKDNPVVPDSNWTTIYQGTGSAGIFHNATDGLISISSDGVTWYTIADKNLGATVVYNWGDAMSESNCGGFFQWGNNYMFPFTGATTVSSTLVDASAYGPGNYYSSSTFIRGITLGEWDSPENLNLWGYVTGATIYNNAITNTGVLVSDQPNNILTSGMKIRAGTEANYQSLANFDSNTLYLTVE